ncbi:hypothetical protein SAMN05192544_103354 [Paraburkholderia hospita]|nr:hypothetical protein SAMN05192544_103354 [Paraburkholderia hospita]
MSGRRCWRDDHAMQERVWNDADNVWEQWPSELHAAITTAEIDARENTLAKFVGLEAYEAPGGHAVVAICSVMTRSPDTSKPPTCPTGSPRIG